MSDENGWPARLTIPEPKDVIVGELAERADWVVANVETSSFWPVNAQEVAYRGEKIWILPLMKDQNGERYPAVALKVRKGKTRGECELLLSRFLSSLAWVQEKGFLIGAFGGGSLPGPMGRAQTAGLAVCEDFDLQYLPEPNGQKPMLALALMREGWGLNHPAYAFLSFFKALEVAFQDGRRRKEWLANRVKSISDYGAKEALMKLRDRGVADVSTHLWESGRCAIAHAREEPQVDPDDPTDYRRLRSELPIIASLAQAAIEEVFGIETSHTVWKRHLYELAGFKEILGPEVVEHLVRGEEIADGRVVNIPRMDVRLRRCDAYAPLKNLAPVQLGQKEHLLYIRMASDDRTAQIDFSLDFPNERLNFELFEGLRMFDAGTPESADAIAELKRFRMEYFANGQLQVFNAETGTLIARKDAFLPENIMVDHKVAEDDIAGWKRRADERRERNRHYAQEMTRYATQYSMEKLQVDFDIPASGE